MSSTNPRVDPQPSPSAPAPEPFAGRFRVVREIGHGAAGRLLLAADLEGGAQVVIKRASDPALVGHEADVLAALVHPGVLRLEERHDTATPPFLVLEPVDGEDLEAVLRRHGGTLDAITLGRLLLRLTEIMEFVHDAGFLHRDLKPGNVLIRPDGAPVIIDFGAAVAQDQAAVSRPWSFVTEGYAAPEQYFADQPEGPWTDVYGLGAMAYRALSGSAPAAALIRAGGAPGDPLAVAGARALALRKAIDWALEPEAADRPQSIAAWRDRLDSALAEAQDEITGPKAFSPTEGSSVADDYPPTVRVARARTGSIGRRAAVRPAEAAPGARRSRWPLVALGLLAAGLVAGALYGWPLYERYVKTAWRVDQAGGGDAVTIADALARARDGATITIAAGTYRESLRIDRPVHLVAGEGAVPVVAPDSGPCALVTSGTGSIVGLAWQPAAPAADAASACLVLAGGAVTLEGNRIAGEGVGLLIRDGADPVVRGNRLEGVRLMVTAGGRGTITENSIVDALGSSLVVRAGADPSLSANVIQGGGGVVFAEGAAGSLVGNRLLATDATGIRVTSGAHPRIIDNTIEGAREAGIFVYDGGGGRLEGNTIAASGLSGVVIAGIGRPELAANRIRENGEHGVLVVEGGRALIEDNEITANQGHGIALGVGSEVELGGNRLEGNDEPQLVDAR